MKHDDARKILQEWDANGRYVYRTEDLRLLLPESSDAAHAVSLNRLAKKGTLVRAAQGVYVYPHGRSFDRLKVLDLVAIALRRGEYNYVSLESMLSEYGDISQIPMVLTVMTTGRRGRHATPYGTIEFTHTQRPRHEVLASTTDQQRPLRVATLESARRDQRRVGRNTDMMETAYVQ